MISDVTHLWLCYDRKPFHVGSKEGDEVGYMGQ